MYALRNRRLKNSSRATRWLFIDVGALQVLTLFSLTDVNDRQRLFFFSKLKLRSTSLRLRSVLQTSRSSFHSALYCIARECRVPRLNGGVHVDTGISCAPCRMRMLVTTRCGRAGTWAGADSRRHCVTTAPVTAWRPSTLSTLPSDRRRAQVCCTLHIYIFIHRLGKRKHARKQTKRKK